MPLSLLPFYIKPIMRIKRKSRCRPVLRASRNTRRQRTNCSFHGVFNGTVPLPGQWVAKSPPPPLPSSAFWQYYFFALGRRPLHGLLPKYILYKSEGVYDCYQKFSLGVVACNNKIRTLRDGRLLLYYYYTTHDICEIFSLFSSF